MTEEVVIAEKEDEKKIEKAIDIELSREGETREEAQKREEREKLERWVPKTELGKEVKSGKINDIQEIFDSGKKIFEAEIADILLPLKSDLLNVGQAKGKFGGGKRRIWRQTQKKTKEGNVPAFSTMAVVGNENGYVGIGFGKAAETLPAKEKALRTAKLNVKKIVRGCGSYDCLCNENHSIPQKVEGKCASVRIVLMPAPQGTGLVAGDEVKKILRLAGIKDIYSKSFGKTRSTINVAKAVMMALSRLKERK